MSKVEKNSGRFQKGKAKTGGRKKGTPNKKTAELLEILGSFNPAEELMKLYDRTLDQDLKVTICKELMKYVYPQRKAIDNTIKGGSFVVNVNNEAVEVEHD